jgi:pectate lyase
VTNTYGTDTSAPAELIVRDEAFPAPAPDGPAANATGGGADGATSVLVTTAETLRHYATAPAPAVLTIQGNIVLDEPLRVGPDKTLQGFDEDATLSGGLLLDAGAANIIIRGLNISNPAAGGIGIEIDGARDIFITHCALFDCAGGLVRITNASENITISWSEFYRTATNTAATPGLFAGTDGDAYPPHITLHHNTWKNLSTAMPLAVNSRTHLYNNYFSATANGASGTLAAGAEILAEHNTYEAVKTPLVKSATNAWLRAIANTYQGANGNWTEPDEGQGLVFSPDYPYLLQPADAAKTQVLANAGNTAGAASPADGGGGDGDAVTLRISGAAGILPYGAPLAFTSSLSGGPAESYQWRLNNFDLPGATGPAYTEEAGAGPASSGAYVLEARLPDGATAMSNPLRIIAGEAPSITRQPDSSLHSPIYPPLKELAVKEGAATSLYAIAAGHPVLKYQWQKLAGAAYQDIPGAESHTLGLGRVRTEDGGSYRVRVTNDFGEATSAAIALAVSPGDGQAGEKGGGGGATSPACAALLLALLLARRRRHGKLEENF